LVGGIYFQVWGNSKVAASSMPAGYVMKSSARKSIEGLTRTGARVSSLPGSPLLISQISRTSARRQHRVTLSWNPSVPTMATEDDVVGYNVYRRTGRGNMYIKINSVPVPDTNYVDVSVHGGETYYYQTTAVSSNGIESAPSNRITVTVPYP
jgi:fibronectin type 3 domain-containing protein